MQTRSLGTHAQIPQPLIYLGLLLRLWKLRPRSGYENQPLQSMSEISKQQATGERLLSGGSVADPVRQQLAASLVLYWRLYRSSRSHRLSKRQFRSLHTILQATRMLTPATSMPEPPVSFSSIEKSGRFFSVLGKSILIEVFVSSTTEKPARRFNLRRSRKVIVCLGKSDR